MWLRWTTLIVVMLLGAGCGTTTGTTTKATTGTTTSTQPESDGSVPAVPCLDGTGSFVGDGPLGTQTRESSDAASIVGLALTPYEGCERLMVDLAAGSGAPATSLGTTSAEFLRESGIVRVHLDPAVDTTGVSDIIFAGSLVDRVFVVRDFDESLFLDVHLEAPAVARYSVISNPARLAVDLAPGGSEIGTPLYSDYVVVMPVPDTGPTGIEGYGRTFEANILLRVRSGGEIISEGFTTATDYLETWGRFTFAFPDDITGNVEIFVGEDSARDGSEQGVYLDVTMGG